MKRCSLSCWPLTQAVHAKGWTHSCSLLQAKRLMLGKAMLQALLHAVYHNMSCLQYQVSAHAHAQKCLWCSCAARDAAGERAATALHPGKSHQLPPEAFYSPSPKAAPAPLPAVSNFRDTGSALVQKQLCLIQGVNPRLHFVCIIH